MSMGPDPRLAGRMAEASKKQFGHFDEITEGDYRQALEIAERLVRWAEAVILSDAQNHEAK